MLFKGKPFTFQRPYGSYVMENVLFKICFPAEFHSQTAVEAAMTLHASSPTRQARRRHREDHDPHARGGIRIIDKKGPLDNPADRDHCIQYMVAVPLIFGRLTAADYEDAIAADPRIDALRDKIDCVEDPQFTKDYHDPDKRSIANALTVEFNDGTQLDGGRGRVPDRPQAPPRGRHSAARVEKFRTNLARRFPDEAAAGDPRRIARPGGARSDAGQ